MNFTPKVKRLEEKKHKLKVELQHLANEFHSGEITKDEYIEKKFKLLDGDFESEAFRKIDKEIEKTKSNYRNGAVVAVVILAFMALQMLPGGITGFATLDDQNLTTVNVNQQYDSNATLELSDIEADSVRVTGSVYGQGEVWIYLTDGGTRKLVHYADTRTGGPTGMATANTTLNETNETVSENSTQANTTNETNRRVIRRTQLQTAQLRIQVRIQVLTKQTRQSTRPIPLRVLQPTPRTVQTTIQLLRIQQNQIPRTPMEGSGRKYSDS